MCQIFVGESANIRSEKYFTIMLDRSFGGPCIVASHKGGVDIEAVAHEDPSAILKVCPLVRLLTLAARS